MLDWWILIKQDNYKSVASDNSATPIILIFCIFLTVDLIRWDTLLPNVLVKRNVRHKGEDCVALAGGATTQVAMVRNTGEVPPHFDVRSDGENIVYFFPKPIPTSSKTK